MSHFVLHNGQQYGPYTVIQIVDFLEKGLLFPSSLIWDQGLQSWIPISLMPKLHHQVRFGGYGHCYRCPCRGFEGNGQVCTNCGHNYASH